MESCIGTFRYSMILATKVSIGWQCRLDQRQPMMVILCNPIVRDDLTASIIIGRTESGWTLVLVIPDCLRRVTKTISNSGKFPFQRVQVYLFRTERAPNDHDQGDEQSLSYHSWPRSQIGGRKVVSLARSHEKLRAFVHELISYRVREIAIRAI